jgi:hypothetical protein
MKRSSSVRRLLLGGFSVGAIAASAAAASEPRVTAESYYTNDYYIQGVGYYHAPFRAFFPRPYNDYDSSRQLYYQGGQWVPTPHRSIVNISTPTPDAARLAENARTDLTRTNYVPRGGFGGSSHSHFIHS